jgi:hypothetical protein
VLTPVYPSLNVIFSFFSVSLGFLFDLYPFDSLVDDDSPRFLGTFVDGVFRVLIIIIKWIKIFWLLYDSEFLWGFQLVLTILVTFIISFSPLIVVLIRSEISYELKNGNKMDCNAMPS